MRESGNSQPLRLPTAEVCGSVESWARALVECLRVELQVQHYYQQSKPEQKQDKQQRLNRKTLELNSQASL